MTTTAERFPEHRTPLSRERILGAAIALADRQGIEAVTMRNLAGELGVEAMSLYYHVANKDALLDGVVDSVLLEVEEELGGFDIAPGNPEWKSTLRAWSLTARNVMLRHPWAPALIETRTLMTPTLLRYMNSILGILLEAGFSTDLGFSRELFAPADPADSSDGQAMVADVADQIPYIIHMLSEVSHGDPDSTLGWCDDQTEYEFGLDLFLDGLEKRLTSP
jgi:AcrR family transcriptional regulator